MNCLKRLAVLALLLIGSRALACGVLMLDFNNSHNEVTNCSAGVQAKNPRDRVWVLGDAQKGERITINAATIDGKISAIENAGGCVDSIVISGDEANGHFFGDNGEVFSSEMADIVKRHPKLENTLTTMMMWGCYTTTDFACQNYWMKNISPGIRAAVGFTLQSPDSDQGKDEAAVLKQVCNRRGDIANAISGDDMNNIANGLAGFQKLQMGICMADGLCSYTYHKVGENVRGCYHTYEELNNSCAQLNANKRDKNGNSLLDLYDNYLAAGKGYEHTPCDGGPDAYKDLGQVCQIGIGAPRLLYNQEELREQCKEQFKSETGYDEPDPNQIIRLIKFPTLKANFGYHEQDLLADYNAKLAAVGLQRDTVPKVDNMSRAEIVSSTVGAIRDLKAMINSTSPGGLVNGVDPRKLLVMANGVDLSLVMLDPQCTDISWVHPETANTKSPCLAKYGDTPAWPTQK